MVKYKLLLEKYDNKPSYWNELQYQANTPLAFLKLSKVKQQKLVEYCKKNFTHRKTPNYHWSSYGLKHFFENSQPEISHVFNGQFKGAMLIAGFIPVNLHEMNWNYCISQKSPALIKHYKQQS